MAINATWNQLKTEYDALPDDYNKLDILKAAQSYFKTKEAELLAILKSVDPANISDVPDDLIRVLINDKWYDLNKSTGELTPR